MHAAYYKSTSTRRCQHLYINSHNSDPLSVKKIKYIHCSYIFLLLLLKVAVSAAALHPWLQLYIFFYTNDYRSLLYMTNRKQKRNEFMMAILSWLFRYQDLYNWEVPLQHA